MNFVIAYFILNLITRGGIVRIGIDLDDTIFDTGKKYKTLQSDFLLKNGITEEELWKDKKNRFDFIKSNFENIFFDLDVKNNAKKTIDLLKTLNHEIYIITARSQRYSKDIFDITKDSLLKNGICFDKLILTEKEKLKACLENKIDIMIDNSIEVYRELYQTNIKIILYDEECNYLNLSNRVSSWQELFEMFRGDEK